MGQEWFQASWRQSDDFDELSRTIGRWPVPVLAARVIKVLLLANLVIYIGWGGLALYRAQMRPNLDRLQVKTERARLIGEAAAHLAAERYGLAVRKYQELLAAFPDDADARNGITRAEQERDLAERYQKAVAFLDAEQWNDAIAALQEMIAMQPGYRDVPARLAFAEVQRSLSRLYQEAEAQFQAADWQAAIATFEAIRREDPDYRRSEVTAQLFEAYLRRGTDLLNTAGRSVPTTEEAIRLFRQALVLQPKQPEASARREVAELYRDGLDLYLRGQWLEATKPLSLALDHGLTMGGDVVELLRSAHAMAGDVYAQAGKYDLAIAQYRSALELMDDAETVAALLARQALDKLANGKATVEAYRDLISEYRRRDTK